MADSNYRGYECFIDEAVDVESSPGASIYLL